MLNYTKCLGTILHQSHQVIKIFNTKSWDTPAFLFHRCSISRDDFLIPVKGFFLGAFECSLAFIVPVHIDKAIALLHLASASWYQINTAPGQAPQNYAVFIDSFSYSLYIGLGRQIVNPVIINHIAIFICSIHCTQTVFHDKHGFLIAIPDGI